MDAIISLDHYLTLLINGTHTAFLDSFFFLISNKLVWIPLYLSIIYVVIRKYGTQGWWIILALALVVVMSDQISSSLLKPLVARLRPSHTPSLEAHIHLVNGYSGGLYGFVSSHAANTAAVTLFLAFVVRRWMLIAVLAVWALLTSYSRVYLGVHFVGDVLGGVLVGLISAIFLFKLFTRMNNRYKLADQKRNFSDKELLPVAITFSITLIVIGLMGI